MALVYSTPRRLAAACGAVLLGSLLSLAIVLPAHAELFNECSIARGIKYGRITFPDPYKEKALHPCVKNIPVLFQCPHGFLYNHIDNVCDAPGLRS
ncbi:hypothetical protein [Nocardiopsis gilva]|uniref:hypothetical protein n=1 Tax=Nocardiopsis gilva TaxID=280236 RepID=UPI0005270D7D|nr:hypothetical protein [Nocardiopsis gilva]